MIASHHTAMLEHGAVYLMVKLPDDEITPSESLYHYKNNKHSVYNVSNRTAYVTTNFRVLVENEWLDDLKYLCEPTIWHEKRYTFRMVTSIGVTRELNRHRVNSIAEQSTRYCNYAKKDKFGGHVSFCIPAWMPQTEKTIDTSNGWGTLPGEELYAFLGKAERHYFYLLEQGWQPQQAREVLPLCTASEIIHTAFASDWRFFFDLRLFAKTGNPHPNMLLLAQKMKAEAEDKDVWNDIMRYHSKF
jgi:thymidylate synthase (FAD)